MRHSWLVLLVCAVPLSAVAQTGPQSSLVLTVFAGAFTGHGLWRVPKQPICQPNASNQCGSSPTYDTLSLTRTVNAGLMGGVSASLFPSGVVGLQLEVAYLALSLSDTCTPVAVTSPANQQVCSDIQGTTTPASTLGLYGGVIARAAARRTISPYLRGGIGLTVTSRSTLALETLSKAIVVDNSTGGIAPSFHAGVGLTSSLGPGYQFRLEIRDILARQDRLDGPANSLGQAPSSSKLYHHLGLTMGLDVVLERKRGRRY